MVVVWVTFVSVTNPRVEITSLGHQKNPFQKHVSNENNPGCLGYIGDEKLPSYIGDYFINHEIRIPSLTNQDDSWKVITHRIHVSMVYLPTNLP